MPASIIGELVVAAASSFSPKNPFSWLFLFVVVFIVFMYLYAYESKASKVTESHAYTIVLRQSRLESVESADHKTAPCGEDFISFPFMGISPQDGITRITACVNIDDPTDGHVRYNK